MIRNTILAASISLAAACPEQTKPDPVFNGTCICKNSNYQLSTDLVTCGLTSNEKKKRIKKLQWQMVRQTQEIRDKFEKVTGITAEKATARHKAKRYKKTIILVKYRTKLNKLKKEYKEEYHRANSKAALKLFYLKKMSVIR